MSSPISEISRSSGTALEHRAARVSLVNGFSTVLTVGIQLVSVPVCLHYWGKQAYGSWLALLSAYLLLRGLDGGYAAFVGNKLNYLYHQSTRALRDHLSSAVFGVVMVGSLQIALAAGAVILNPVSAALGMSMDGAGGTANKLGLLALITSWVLTGSYLGIVYRLLIPAGLMYQAAWWAIAYPICQFAAVIVSAILRLELLSAALLFAASQMAVSVSIALYVRRALPRFTPWLDGAKARVGIRDFGHSLFLTGSNLVQQATTNGSVLLVSVLAGPVAVSTFTTVRTLTILWNSVTTILSAPLLPDVVRMHATGEVKKLVATNRAYWVLAGSAVNLGAVLSFPLIPRLYATWTVGAVALDRPLLCLLLGSAVAANSGALIAVHLNGINSLRIVLGTSVTRAVLTLGVGAMCFPRYGLAAFGFGALAGEILATLITVSYFVRYEVEKKGSIVPIADFGPISLSTGSVILYFLGASLGFWSVGYVWLLTAIVVIVASLWGWRTLDDELQTRLLGIPIKLLGF